MSRSDEGYEHVLGVKLAERLLDAPAAVQELVVYLLSPSARERLRGLDLVSDRAFSGSAVTSTVPDALPFLFSLCAARGYPDASAVLLRIAAIAFAIDDPPRSASGAVIAHEPSASAWRALEEALPAILRLARVSRDPEAARTAACIAARFPRADADVEPLLLALLSGAPTPDERARLLYALARIQDARGATLHPRIERALCATPPTAETVAVVLALGDRPPVVAARERITASGTLSSAIPDPRAFGKLLDPAALT
jgi:hypothetical protein